MKAENFEKVKTLIILLEQNARILVNLKGPKLQVIIRNENIGEIVKLKADKNNDAVIIEYTNFIKRMIEIYENRLDEIKRELLTL